MKIIYYFINYQDLEIKLFANIYKKSNYFINNYIDFSLKFIISFDKIFCTYHIREIIIFKFVVINLIYIYICY